jgi:hypothetical protein
MTLAIGVALLIAGLGMIFAALPSREGLPRSFLSGSVEIFYNLPALHGDVAETLHRHAKLTLDDMIVMEAYVHSRVRQMVLGGTTQSLFKDCPVPLFLSY